MKKVICIISERNNKYIFDLYLIKENKTLEIVNKLPFSVNKKDLTEKVISDYRKMIYSFISNAKYTNVHLIIGIDIKNTIRDEIILPEISTREFKKAVEMEISKRYNGKYIKYYSKTKREEYYNVKIILLNKELKEFLDKVYLPLPFNIKGLTFLGEAIKEYTHEDIKNKFNVASYIFLYYAEDKYIINVIINEALKYSYTQEIDDTIITRITSLYGYYFKDTNEEIQILVYSERTKNTLQEIEKKGLRICWNIISEKLDIMCLMNRKNYHYEKME